MNTPTPNLRKLLSYQEAAEFLGVSDRTIWALVRRKQLTAVRFGRNVRIDPEDLKVFIRKAKDGRGANHVS